MKALVLNCSPVRTGATAEITRIIAEELSSRYEVIQTCIDDYSVHFCLGCRRCHTSGQCVQEDDAARLMGVFAQADVIVLVSPSYWADVPGQFKTFIDRCTPWSNTHDPHASIGSGKMGYAVVLRTGGGMYECERLIATIEHFFGHLEILRAGSLALCNVEYLEDVAPRAGEIRKFCLSIGRDG
ncbi:MAG TPA: flavodoxin family protein [Ruminococcus sp.]|nr:flavodoxin family protein [Ruminococcus sp.]